MERRQGRQGRQGRQTRLDAPEPVRRRLTLRLSTEAARRLGVTCAMEGLRPGELVEALVLERSRRWVVQDRGKLPKAHDVPQSPE